MSSHSPAHLQNVTTISTAMAVDPLLLIPTGTPNQSMSSTATLQNADEHSHIHYKMI
jgi:hypothetical protein